MLRALLIVSILGAVSCSGACTTAQCRYRNPPVIINLLNHNIISKAIEGELKRQFWYFLRNSILIDENRLELNDRLIIYYYHQNYIGTFLTVCSWYYTSMKSEINTFLRIGSGVKNGSGLIQGWPQVAGAARLVDGQKSNLNSQLSQIKSAIIDSHKENKKRENPIIPAAPTPVPLTQQERQQCIELSSSHVLEEQKQYLSNSKLINSKSLQSSYSQYNILTHSGEQGTYLAVTSCHKTANPIKIHTFVRLSSGKAQFKSSGK